MESEKKKKSLKCPLPTELLFILSEVILRGQATFRVFFDGLDEEESFYRPIKNNHVEFFVKGQLRDQAT